MHPMDPTAGRTDGTRDHVPVHVCFQGVAFAFTPSDRTSARHLGDERDRRLQAGAQLYTME